MAESKRKGDVGEAMVLADVLRQGHKVALPVGEDWRYDLIVLRHGKLERVQCKYVESDGLVIEVPGRSSNSHSTRLYTSDEIDCLAVYDKTTESCYYIPSSEIGSGKSLFSLRLVPSSNGQVKRVRWAKDYKSW